MLHRDTPHGPHGGRQPGEANSSAHTRLLIAVAPPPRLTNPTRWGWPHWLAPASRAGGHHASNRPLEDYA
jgi:hypothetical protein